MHILVTGGAGFIGSHIVDFHIAKGDKVHVIDNLTTGSIKNISHHLNNNRFKFDQVDIRNTEKLRDAVIWADRIYHMAAIVGMFRVMDQPTEVMEVNVSATERMLKLAYESHWNPQIVLASSSEVYGIGENNKPFNEKDPLKINSVTASRWNYAISKLADEALAMSYYKKYSLNVMSIRFFNTIGTRQIGRYGMVLPRFVKQAVNNEPITVYGSGSQIRSFCDVRDTVNYLDQLCDNKLSSGNIFNVGNDYEITILDLAKMVKRITGSRSSIKHIDYSDAYGNDYEEVKMRKPDLTKLKKYTNYTPRYTLEDTINSLVEIHNEGKISSLIVNR